jgi:uncharacterized protein (DUF58 family)
MRTRRTQEKEQGRERACVDAELLKEVRRIQLRTDRLVTDVVSGGYSSVFRGSGIEFDEVREWAEGDDIRSVDWNVTARQGRPFIKKFVEERELTLLFVLDVSRSMDFASTSVDGKPRSLRRLAVEFLACLGLSAGRNNDKVGILTFAQDVDLYVPPKKGRAHLLRLLRESLARVEEDRGSGLGAALAYASRVQRKKCILFVLSDFLCDWPEKEVRLAARRHDLILVPTLDPRLLDLPQQGLFRLRDVETGQEQVLDASSGRVREAYAAQMRAFYEERRAGARKFGADWLTLDTRESVTSNVVAFFRQREARSAKR